jgi:hypothetical protein
MVVNESKESFKHIIDFIDAHVSVGAASRQYYGGV